MKILCIGDLNADLIVPYAEAKSYAVNKSANKKAEVSLRAGGTVGNVASVLGKLGANPYLVTNLYDDGTGKFLEETLIQYGVDLTYSKRVSGDSLICIAVIDDAKERVILPWVPPRGSFLKFSASSFADIPEDDYLIFTSGMVLTNEEETMKSVTDFMEHMKNNTGSVFVTDLNLRKETYGLNRNRRKYLHKLIRLSDVIMGSREEDFGCLTKGDEPEEYCRKLSKTKTVIVHDGNRPSAVYEKGKCVTVPVKKVKVYQTVGAGDTFDAGFLYAYQKGKTVTECVKEGNRIAGYMISHKGHLEIPKE